MRIRTSNKDHVSTLIEECVKNGLKHVVCSPGSRNAPIVITLDEHPEIETSIIHDERSAAFYALGMAQILKEPVGLVCTSGSAMLNYYPGVAEAFYQGIPIVVLSADRTEEWVNHGDGQTIVQKEVYTNHIQYQTIIREGMSSQEIADEVHKAFDAALRNWKGPIHINIPLSEPLYDTIEVDWEKQPSIDHIDDEISLTKEELAEITLIWNNSPRKMILCGQHDRDIALTNRLLDLTDDSSIAVLVENTSNLVGQRWVHCIDRTLAGISSEEIEKFQPDLLITIGGAIVSKRIKKFLRDAPIKAHWKIGYDFPEMDTYRALTHAFASQPEPFLKLLLSLNLPKHASNFGSNWKQRDFEVQQKLSTFFDSADYSDLSVFETILDYIPENSYLHMANSSVVRYCQLFEPISSVRYFSNRGTSGIDGSTSTACGVALASPSKCNVLITGDISFFYDSNALWNLQLPSNLRIILINNGGGGIFRIIPGPRESKQLERYFEAQHDRKAEFICKAHDVRYSNASSLAEIEAQMADFYAEGDRPKLLEIFTPRELNSGVLDAFFDSVGR